MSARPRILICCNSTVRREYIAGEGVSRLDHLADWEWLPSEGTSSRVGVWGGPSDDPADATRLAAKLAEGFDALITCHGALMARVTSSKTWRSTLSSGLRRPEPS